MFKFWIPFYEEVKVSLAYKKSTMTFQSFLTSTLVLNSDRHLRSTGYSSLNIICPHFKRKFEGGKCFAVNTSQLWNALPIYLRRKPSVKSFKQATRKRFLDNQID